MCTLAISVGLNPDWPLIIAANRDEALTRPSSPPLRWEGETPFVAPRDELAGGSWLGYNAAGIFVGITNRFGAVKYEDRESRGALVVEALRHRNLESLHDALGRMRGSRFNAFHLLYSDGNEVGVTWSDGAEIHQERHGPSLQVLSERSFGASDEGRVDWVRGNWPGPLADGTPDVDGLKALLAHHDDRAPFTAPCVHAPAFNYGTRSSLLLFVARDPGPSRAFWADGPPCRTAFRSFDALIREL